MLRRGRITFVRELDYYPHALVRREKGKRRDVIADPLRFGGGSISNAVGGRLRSQHGERTGRRRHTG
jgi:hypothetical protein